MTPHADQTQNQPNAIAPKPPAYAQRNARKHRKQAADRAAGPITRAEVVAAQRAWAKCVVEQDVDTLLGLYDFSSPEAPILFKPTLTDVIRLDEPAARSYFVGGNPDYPHDSGFLFKNWKRVEFKSSVGPVRTAGGHGYQDMGHYSFFTADGAETRVDYTFAYHKVDGKVLITLHHSSLTWAPDAA